MSLLRSKLTLIVLSAALVGGAVAMLVVLSTIRPPSYISPALAANNSAGASSGTNTTGGAAATATATRAGHSAGSTPGSTPGANPTGTATASPSGTPTATPVPTNTAVPTPRPTPTPTPIPVPGQQLTIHGDVDVASVNTTTNTFVVNVDGGGGTYTITVSPPGTTGGTSWPGPISSLSQLAISPGARATVTGIYQAGGGLDATNNGTVYAFIDN